MHSCNDVFSHNLCVVCSTVSHPILVVVTTIKFSEPKLSKMCEKKNAQYTSVATFHPFVYVLACYLFCFDVLHFSFNLHILAMKWQCFSDLTAQDGIIVVSTSSPKERWNTHVAASSWRRLSLQIYTASDLAVVLQQQTTCTTRNRQCVYKLSIYTLPEGISW